MPGDQLLAERLGHLMRQDRLARAGLALDQQRPFERDRSIDGDLQILRRHIGLGALETLHAGAVHCRYRKSNNPRRPGTPAWRSCAALFGLALGVARRLFGRHPVALLEPAAEIDIGAALRAEGLMPRDRGLVADWAAALAGGKGCDGVLRHDF